MRVEAGPRHRATLSLEAVVERVYLVPVALEQRQRDRLAQTTALLVLLLQPLLITPLFREVALAAGAIQTTVALALLVGRPHLAALVVALVEVGFQQQQSEAVTLAAHPVTSLVAQPEPLAAP